MLVNTGQSCVVFNFFQVVVEMGRVSSFEVIGGDLIRVKVLEFLSFLNETGLRRVMVGQVML